MHRQYRLVCLLLLFISGYRTQDSTIAPESPTPPVLPTYSPDWNGDPKLCTVSPSVTSPPGSPAPPTFPTKAEFTLERIEIKHVLDTALPSELTMYEYIFDYESNNLIVVTNKNGFISVEYYYYNKLKKSTYLGGDICVVTNITVKDDMNGNSAIYLPTGEPHVRTLGELLLFTNSDPTLIVGGPVYRGKDTARGIPVDIWETCLINKAQHRTVSRIWAFAQKNVSMPSGAVTESAIPVEALIRASYVLPNGQEAVEFDEVYNVLSYRPGIIESNDALSPPKGVFCSSGKGQQLISLNETGVGWPERFSVRVEASTSRSTEWQRFHLRYDHGRFNGSKRIRYDYMPVGAEDYESVIHDYGDNLTWIIDRRVGTCKIRRGVEIPSVSPIRDPIAFFIKHEKYFIYDPPAKAWEHNGYRSCRGNAIQCTILTTEVPNFPPFVASDTGLATNESWKATSVEYGWTIRAQSRRPAANDTIVFDYPVSLYLKLYRYENPSVETIETLRTENIEYEFYELSYDRNPFDFDISSCYRSLNYDYLHLTLILKFNKANIIDGTQLNRAQLERRIHYNILNLAGITYSRVADVEIDHEQVSREVTIFFTILGQTPQPDTQPHGVDQSQPTVEQARINLASAIDGGQFQFTMTTTDNTEVQFTASSGSLKYSKQYISTHESGKKVINESYTAGAQAGAVIGGILIGLVVGLIIAAIIRKVRKEPMPSLPKSVTNPMTSINFHANKPTAASSDTSDS